MKSSDREMRRNMDAKVGDGRTILEKQKIGVATVERLQTPIGARMRGIMLCVVMVGARIVGRNLGGLRQNIGEKMKAKKESQKRRVRRKRIYKRPNNWFWRPIERSNKHGKQWQPRDRLEVFMKERIKVIVGRRSRKVQEKAN